MNGMYNTVIIISNHIINYKLSSELYTLKKILYKSPISVHPDINENFYILFPL